MREGGVFFIETSVFVGWASPRQGRLKSAPHVSSTCRPHIAGVFHGNTIADLPSRRCIRSSSLLCARRRKDRLSNLALGDLALVAFSVKHPVRGE